MADEGPEEVFGVGVNVPEGSLGELMDAIDSAMGPVYPGYRRSFFYFPVKGTWTALEGAHPYDGRAGETTVADEYRLRFVVRRRDLPGVLAAIDRARPYEEPAVDVFPEVPWRSLIPSP